MKKLILLNLVVICLSVSSFVFAETVIRVSIPAYAETTKESFDKIAKDYEKENPGIKIEVEGGSWTTWQQKISTDFFSGGNPDLIFSTRGWVPTYVAEGKIEALDNYLTKKDLAMFPASLLNGAKVNGRQYALPSVTSARNLYVNLDLLKKVGAGVPKTWKELRNVAKLVTEKTDAAGFGIQGKEVEMEKYFYYILWNYGGSVLDKVVEGKKATLDTKEAIEAAKFYESLIKDGYTQKNVTAYNREDLVELFKQGKLAMMITHGVLAEQIQSEGHNINFIQTDVPGLSKNKKGITLGVIDAVHLSKNSKHKKEAVKFLLYSFKPQYQAEWVGNANLLPVTVAGGKEPVFKKKHLQAMISAVPNAQFAFIHEKSTKIIDILKVELQALYAGKKSAERAMKDATNKINRAIRR